MFTSHKCSLWQYSLALLMIAALMLGCKQSPPPKPKLNGSITFSKKQLGYPTFEQIEAAFKEQKWDDPNELPMFQIFNDTQNLRISRWFDRNVDGEERFEKSHRIVAVWNPGEGEMVQCQLDDAAQAFDLVMSIARGEDLTSKLEWFEY